MPLVVSLKNNWILLFFIISIGSLNAQKKLTYYDDIQPIIDKNCVTCHRQGHVAPFPLNSFEEVNKGPC